MRKKSLYGFIARLTHRRGVSPIIGIAIIVAIMVTFFAIIYTFRLTQQTEEQRRSEERTRQIIAYQGEHLSIFDYCTSPACTLGSAADNTPITIGGGNIYLELGNDGTSDSQVIFIKINDSYNAINPPRFMKSGEFSQIAVPAPAGIALQTDLPKIKSVVIGTELGNAFTYSSLKAVIIRGFESVANCKTTVNFDGSASNSVGATIVSYKWDALDLLGGKVQSITPTTTYSQNATIAFDFVDPATGGCLAGSNPIRITLTVKDSLGRQDQTIFDTSVTYAETKKEAGGGGERGWEYPIGHIIGSEAGVATSGDLCNQVMVSIRNYGTEQVVIGSLRFFWPRQKPGGGNQIALTTVRFPNPDADTINIPAAGQDPGVLVPLKTAAGAPYNVYIDPGQIRVIYLAFDIGAQTEMCGKEVTTTVYRDHEGGKPVNEFLIPATRRCAQLNLPTNGSCQAAPGNITLSWVYTSGAYPCTTFTPNRVKIEIFQSPAGTNPIDFDTPTHENDMAWTTSYTWNFGAGAWLWRYMAYRDANGNGKFETTESNSGWSVFYNLRIGDCTVPSVIVTAPNGGETWNIGSTHDITWTATDNVGLREFNIYFSSDNGASWMPVVENIPGSGTSYNGTYSWTVPNECTTAGLIMVVAFDTSNNVGTDQSNAVFIIPGAGGVPTVPTLESPANGAIDIGLINPSFNWSDSTGCGPITYTLQVDDDPAFGSPLINQAGIVTSNYTWVGTLTASTTYYWHVSAQNGSGSSAWTASWSFTTAAAATYFQMMV